MATQKTKQKIVAAFLSLLAEKGWSGFDMSDVAEAAGVKLSVLRGAFASKTACFRAFLADIDQKVLDSVDPDMTDEPARDRLFDVLMSRLDALQPHREAVRALMAAARKDPQLALTLNGEARMSQRWMLTAAGLPSSGFRAQMIAQGLVVAFSGWSRSGSTTRIPGLRAPCPPSTSNSTTARSGCRASTGRRASSSRLCAAPAHPRATKRPSGDPETPASPRLPER
ncbi:MAG: TetR/AcrR family transcriptional regulator [Alphaproteobacteria bacterium]|nr:TetR/AcrR family transcriptional regulator [Alphaproteobacteria bacterium]